MTPASDTIFAPATAPGRAGVAVLRISGPQAAEALASLGVTPLPAPRRAKHCVLKTNGTALDDALALWFPAPHSFTGEDVAELHIHGSRAVMKALMEHFAALPHMRPAGPGEFTRRAFLNGKLDLAQAEGMADLIDAETEAQRRQALAQLQGALGRELEGLRQAVIRPLAHLEAVIDFPDEEIPESVMHGLNAEIQAVIARIEAMLAAGKRGERIREGFSVVILGAPNAGKSSLINALARRDLAIVSPQAGTTRDVLEAPVDIGGLPVVLIDTAGLRDSSDPVEQEGIRRARARAEDADLKLVLFDATHLPFRDAETEAQCCGNHLVVLSKADLLTTLPKQNRLAISAITGYGLEALVSAIRERLEAEAPKDGHALLTRARHRSALERAREHLNNFSPQLPIELACEELRCAAEAIGEIAGKIDVEDLLDTIFKEFCIGK